MRSFCSRRAAAFASKVGLQLLQSLLGQRKFLFGRLAQGIVGREPGQLIEQQDPFLAHRRAQRQQARVRRDNLVRCAIQRRAGGGGRSILERVQLGLGLDTLFMRRG